MLFRSSAFFLDSLLSGLDLIGEAFGQDWGLSQGLENMGKSFVKMFADPDAVKAEQDKIVAESQSYLLDLQIKYKEAEKTFRLILDLSKDDASAHFYLGTIYNELKKDAKGTDYRWHYSWEEVGNSGNANFGSLFVDRGAHLRTLTTAPTISNLKNTSGNKTEYPKLMWKERKGIQLDDIPHHI